VAELPAWLGKIAMNISKNTRELPARQQFCKSGTSFALVSVALCGQVNFANQ